MATKTLKTRIVLRNDTLANWNDSDATLKKGEVALATDSNKVQIKVGNNGTFGNALPLAISANNVLGLDAAIANKISTNDAYVAKTSVAFTPTAATKTVEITVDDDTANVLSSTALAGYATETYVATAIDALDVAALTGTTAQTITSISETDGKIAATYADISVAQSQVAGLDTALAGKVSNGAIGISYDTDNKKIKLTGTGAASDPEIDASAFIKDGMLSAATYDSTAKKIVLTFNTDAGANPISVDVASLVDTYTAGTGLTVTNNQFALSAASATLGGVATSSANDAVAVDASTGVMTVNTITGADKVSTNALFVPTGDELILDGGTSSAS